MVVMGAQLRKITAGQAAFAAALSGALTGGMALALQSTGNDPRQALEGSVPIFVGVLIALAGIDPVRNPGLTAIVGLGAMAAMMAVRALVP